MNIDFYKLSNHFYMWNFLYTPVMSFTLFSKKFPSRKCFSYSTNIQNILLINYITSILLANVPVIRYAFIALFIDMHYLQYNILKNG